MTHVACAHEAAAARGAQASRSKRSGSPALIAQGTTRPGRANKGGRTLLRASDDRPRHDDEKLAALGIRRYSSTRLILYSDVAPEKVRALPALMDRAYDAWVEYFGPLPPNREGSDFQMTGYLIGDKALFRETGLIPEDLPPFPHGRHKGTRFWMNDQPTDYYRRHLLLHEGTHCYMTAVQHPLGNQIWYMEGMAELFGTHRINEAGEPTFRVMPHDREQFANLGRIRLVEDEVREKGPRTLASVMRLPSDAFLANPAYAWSWALCQFLDAHPRYGEAFRKGGHTVVTGESTGDWQKLFDANRADLEEAWLLFAGNLVHGFDQSQAAIEFRAGVPLERGESRVVEIAADRGWQSSGTKVEAGKTYHVIARGRFIVANANRPDDPELEKVDRPWHSEPGGISFRYHAGQPLGRLVGTIRATPAPEASPFTTMLEVIPLGPDASFQARVSGTLYLRVNDDWSGLDDNAGRVRVEVEGVTTDPKP